MARLDTWKEKIISKRKNTDFRNFVLELMSWDTLVLQKNSWLISRYPNTERIAWVVSMSVFDDLRDGLLSISPEYDFTKTFFENFADLYRSIKLPAIINIWSENSDFSEISIFVKNAYLSFTTVSGCENILYSVNIKDNSRNVLNSVMVWDSCENVYMSSWIIKSSSVFYSQNIVNSRDIWFSTNLVWCSECISCSNVENVSYQISNKQYTKDEYLTKKKELLSNPSWFDSLYQKSKVKSTNIWSKDTIWTCNFYCENLNSWAYNYKVIDWKNVVLVWLPTWNKNIYDTYNAGSPIWSDMYWVMAAWWEHIYMTLHNNNWTNNFYSILLDECSFCLWCVWLKNKSYCIFNKQYSQEEWFNMVDKIFASMEQSGELGEFFPATMNPYYFNDTVASLFDLWFSKQEVINKWFLWRDEEVKVDIPTTLDKIGVDELSGFEWFDSDGKWYIDNDVMNKVVVDKFWNSYRFVPMEIEFLKRYNLPLPRQHWLDRIKTQFVI